MRNRHNDRLDEFIERPKKAVWIVAAPMMAGFMVHAFYAVVDAAFIGRIGPEALAAATYVGAFFFAAIAFTNGLSIGITATVAQAIGRRDSERTHQLASNGLSFGILLGVLFAAAGLLFGRELLALMGATGKTADLAWDYMSTICIGMPLFFFTTAVRAVLNGEGDAKTPMIILTIATLVNVTLDPIFIFTLGWGIKGAAYATVLAQTISLSCFCYVAFVRGRMSTRFRLSLIPPRSTIIKEIAALGIPMTAGHIIMAAGMGLTNKVVSKFGQIAVTGYGAGSKVDMLVALPVLGLAAASVTVVGMFAGAGRADLVRSTALYTFRLAITTAVVMGAAAFLISGTLIGIFTDDPTALRIGREYIHFTVFAYPFMAFGMTSGRILQGLGFGVPTMIITALRVVVVGVGGSYIAVYGFDAPIEAVWISFICGGFFANVLALHWVRKYVWKSDPCVIAARKRVSAKA
jgi:putative MATE family efflux protein